MNSPSISPFYAPYHFNSVGLSHIYYIIQGVLPDQSIHKLFLQSKKMYPFS